MEGQLRTALQTNNDLDSIQALSANKFPYKLWKIVNECGSGSIKWNTSGRNIIVHKSQFQEEYLDPLKKTFKTSNIGSFIRQLNLYGFKKVQPACKQYPGENTGEQEIQEFHNIYFRRGRPDLVNELRRHVGVRRAKAHEARQDQLKMEDGRPAKIFKREMFMNVDTTQPPSLLAVPIFSDGIPYLNANLPPVLVEWDEDKKRWEPKGPAIGTIMNCTTMGDKLPEGAQMGDTTGSSSEKFGPLVAAVSDALRSVPEEELQACLGPKMECTDRKQLVQQIPSPISVEPSDPSGYGVEECPYPACLCPTPVQPPQCSDYSPDCCSPYLFDAGEFLHSPTIFQNSCKFPDESPIKRCSSPIFSSPTFYSGKDLISLTFSPIDFSLSPINTQHEY